MSCIADDLADSAALVTALLAGDVEGVRAIVRNGDARGMCLILAGRLACALRVAGAEDAELILAGMRADAEARRPT